MMLTLLAIFAVYRVARLLAFEEGPFEVCTWVRNQWLADDWIGRGLRCPLCIGFWLALLAAVIVAPSWGVVSVYWFGIAGAQALIHRIAGD